MTSIAREMLEVRRKVAARYLRGHGIEIGALDCPLALPAAVAVKYVDRVSVAELRGYYPELADRELTEPDIIDDGERLTSLANDSLDFIIANHMLEHCENPLGTMRVHLERLRPGGVLYYAIPDKRQCFDRVRPLTTFAPLVADDADGGAASRRDHFLEWATHVNAIADPQVAAVNAETNMRNNYSIHFHVWDPETFRDFLDKARDYLPTPFAIDHFRVNGSEVISVMRRT